MVFIFAFLLGVGAPPRITPHCPRSLGAIPFYPRAQILHGSTVHHVPTNQMGTIPPSIKFPCTHPCLPDPHTNHPSSTHAQQQPRPTPPTNPGCGGWCPCLPPLVCGQLQTPRRLLGAGYCCGGRVGLGWVVGTWGSHRTLTRRPRPVGRRRRSGCLYWAWNQDQIDACKSIIA